LAASEPALHHPHRIQIVIWQAFVPIFLTIFLAGIGDKTQLATMLFSSDASANR
jgi:putative Ca2+/H+ antiporter (TMEM165/GDT1 family)